MAFTVLVHTIKGSATGTDVTSDPIDTSGADVLFLVAVQNQVATISDNKSNTWNGLTEQTDTVKCRIFYATNVAGKVGSGHTFTIASTGFPTVIVIACSGAHLTAPFDQQNGAHQATGTSESTGSVTPAEDNEIVITGAATNGTPTWAIDNGFTISDSNSNAGNNFAGAMAYKIQTTAAAVNPQWSGWADGFSALAIATFKAASLSAAQELPALLQAQLEPWGKQYV